MKTEAAAALSLLSASAVRQRAQSLLAIGLEDGLPHFRIDLERLEKAADLVVETTREAYPDLEVPFHSRWRHFVVGRDDRWAAIEAATPWRDAAERARAAFDLAVTSVLLDAGAGPQWSYRDPATGIQVGRSEGLALASLAMFTSGAFSARPESPLRADAIALEALTVDTLSRHFQVSDANPLVGVHGRAELLARLGAAVAAKPEVFARADAPRPGGLFDHLAARAGAKPLPAPDILKAVLHHLGAIWPGRISLDRVSLGDTWRHHLIRRNDETDGLIPFHKLSQWLTCSLVEPLREGGIACLLYTSDAVDE